MPPDEVRPAVRTPAEAALEVVARSAAETPVAGIVESINVIDVATGQWPLEIVTGIELRWRQGDNLFGLLIPIDRLEREAGELEAVPFYLRLAVEEPHGAAPNGVRLWFTDLPSGPY